ncbi:MAG: nucleoside monophosphate kinase [Smithellaceae bacterium]|nr:nucleoside monophosphate kinase [Smithellaceae bacterium]
MNIILFGPNGSGKGTQGAAIGKRYAIPHIETGVIFRHNIAEMTALGSRAQAYIERGELVPDEITIPMILNRLKDKDAKKGWLLDGFPRNLAQAEALWLALAQVGIGLDYVIEIRLDRAIAKRRIMGRRLCRVDNNHPNNIFIDEIMPIIKDGGYICRVCGNGDLLTRKDDQDEEAIDKRHAIYFDARQGTMAAINFFQDKTRVVPVEGLPPVPEVSREIFYRLP